MLVCPVLPCHHFVSSMLVYVLPCFECHTMTAAEAFGNVTFYTEKHLIAWSRYSHIDNAALQI